MLMPKRTKFRKQMKGRRRGVAYRGSKVSFGDFGLQAVEPGWIKSRAHNPVDKEKHATTNSAASVFAACC